MTGNLEIKKDCTRPKEQSTNNLQSGHSTHTNHSPSIANSQSKSVNFLSSLLHQTQGDGDCAIALQVLNCLLKTPHLGVIDSQGRRFVYNTLTQWQTDYFQDWSRDKIGRVFRRLEELGLIETTSSFNSENTNNRKWYTINYNRLSSGKQTDRNYSGQI